MPSYRRFALDSNNLAVPRVDGTLLVFEHVRSSLEAIRMGDFDRVMNLPCPMA